MDKDLKLALISEVREDLRIIEQQRITLVLAYYGFFTLIVSIIFSNNVNILKANSSNLAIFTLLFVLGIILNMMLISYKNWQKHYFQLLKSWISEFDIEDKDLPAWLAKKYNKITPWTGDILLRTAAISLTFISLIAIIFYILRLILKI